MADAGFFRGTSIEQDSRFADKEKRLMQTMKFDECLDLKVNLKKVNLATLKPWITEKITSLLGTEDEVVIEYIFNTLEEGEVNAKRLQINLVGFLEQKNARIFMKELWQLLLSAQDSVGGIPKEFLEAKKAELALGGNSIVPVATTSAASASAAAVAASHAAALVNARIAAAAAAAAANTQTQSLAPRPQVDAAAYSFGLNAAPPVRPPPVDTRQPSPRRDRERERERERRRSRSRSPRRPRQRSRSRSRSPRRSRHRSRSRSRSPRRPSHRPRSRSRSPRRSERRDRAASPAKSAVPAADADLAPTAGCMCCGRTDDPKRCSGCMIAFYCSDKCQASDWTRHRPACKAAQAKRAEASAGSSAAPAP